MSFLSKFKSSSFLITFVLFLLFISLSCQKKEQPKSPEVSKNPTDSLLNPENIAYLENTIDYMENMMILKKLGAKYVDVIAKPVKYEEKTDSKIMIMRFGMLSVDIAYSKIIGGKTQLPEYDKIFKMYVKELDIQNFVKSTYDDYAKILSEKELNDSLFEYLKNQFKMERKELVNSAKNLDEVFLIYYTMGAYIELIYLKFEILKREKSNELGIKISEYFKADGKPLEKFFMSVCQHQCSIVQHMEYTEIISKLKPALEIWLNNNGKSTPRQIKTITKTFNDIRNEIL